MSAVLNTRNQDVRFGCLEAPYCQMNPEALLAYYQARGHVHYFSVIDEEQNTPEKLEGILRNRFEFNHEPYQLDDAFDWLTNPSSDVEWLILLHKFYYAVGLGRHFEKTGDTHYRDKWQTLTIHWIDNVPVDFLSSDVTGRRVQNWIFAYRYFVSAAAEPAIDAEFNLDFLASLQQQVAYLCENLTPARNHRTLELYAIFLAAVVFPELRGAKEWLSFSTRELQRNLQTDLLADGVHCELSTDYHHIVLRNFLGIRRLAMLNNIELPADMDEAIKKALSFCLHAHKPDGFIPAISDGDSANFLDLLRQGHELYQDPAMLYVATAGQQGQAPAERSKTFTASGYSILRSGWGEQDEAYQDERYLFFDCAPLGAGNHGHLDLLNIEVAAYGRSLIVDPGRYTYDESGDTNWRVMFRGTGYHNTVQVDGKNQTLYAPHIRKYKIQGPEPTREFKCALHRPGFDYLHGIAASHEYPVIHERKIVFIAGEYWLVCDLLRAEQSHDYELRFHLDALAEHRTTTCVNSAGLRVDSPNLVILQAPQPDTKVALEPGFVSSSYGSKYPAPVVNFSAHATSYCFLTVLYPYQSTPPQLTLEPLPVSQNGQAVGSTIASALRIHNQQAQREYYDELFLAHRAGAGYEFADLNTESAFLFRRQDTQGRILAWHSADKS
ncbi:alginate lyase family protein [Methylomonas sp. MK1]|uniref:alginate lyase family protein n=1 Tax=Methylomonas sp. MK1 TaxID=1131552 RepID=UPI00035EB2C6|nr:alginate lyase family protein [Methylomonas sp. MK1]